MVYNRIIKALAMIALSCTLISCDDRPDRMFRDFFVSVADETGAQTSRILSSSNNLVMTYYFSLVSEELKEPLTVNFDLQVGDGLKEGKDFAFQTQARSITFEPGVYKKPFRINYLSNPVDDSKDNTIKIIITSTSDPSIIIGYPGPSAKYSTHTITKYN
ncbi:MAG: hypothetical protein IJL22_05465 [Bacteroidales bacterium]|nr:hypothetical protein [Bacteroidales bacterium]